MTPIPSGFEHLNRAGEEVRTFTLPVGFNDTVKVKAPSLQDAERIASLPLPTNDRKGGEK